MRFNILRFCTFSQADRTVDAGAGIPSGVGLIRIAGDDFHGIVPFGQERIAVHRKGGISIRAEGRLFSIEPDLRAAVHAVKRKHMVHVRLLP